jgi:hypothetical protein
VPEQIEDVVSDRRNRFAFAIFEETETLIQAEAETRSKLCSRVNHRNRSTDVELGLKNSNLERRTVPFAFERVRRTKGFRI